MFQCEFSKIENTETSDLNDTAGIWTQTTPLKEDNQNKGDSKLIE